MSLVLASCGLFGDERTSETPTVVDEDGNGSTGSAAAGDCADQEIVCVGIVLGPGGIEARNLEDMAAGARDLVDSLELVAADDTSQVGLQLGTFVDASVDLIVVGGADTGDQLIEAAERSPELTFVSLGTIERDRDGDVPANLVSVEIDSVDTAFLAGATAGLLTETGKIGAVLGSDVDDEMTDIRAGWEAGARFVNPEIELFTAFHPGGTALGFTDPAWGAETARSQIDAGVDVLVGAGGMTGNAALVEAARSADGEGEGVRCVGAFADALARVPEAQPCVFTSILVDVEEPLADLIERFADGDELSGTVEVPAYLAPFKGVSDEISEQADQLSFQIAQGGIDTDG